MPCSVQQDVWAFGVLLYELGAGEDLFPKDICDDVLPSRASRLKLLEWQGAPIEDCLEAVYKQLHMVGGVTHAHSKAAQDRVNNTLP